MSKYTSTFNAIKHQQTHVITSSAVSDLCENERQTLLGGKGKNTKFVMKSYYRHYSK